MITPKIQHKLLALTVLTLLTVVYTLMAATLLRAQNADIVFYQQRNTGA